MRTPAVGVVAVVMYVKQLGEMCGGRRVRGVPGRQLEVWPLSGVCAVKTQASESSKAQSDNVRCHHGGFGGGASDWLT